VLFCSHVALVQAKERLRIATEKLYQQEVDAEIMLEQMKEDISNQMDRFSPLTPAVVVTCESCAIFFISICGSMLEMILISISLLVWRFLHCSCQETLERQSQLRLEHDLHERATIPGPVLEVWRILNDEKDVWEGLAFENRERLLPLEHSDLNDIESSVAQKRIRQVPRHSLSLARTSALTARLHVVAVQNICSCIFFACSFIFSLTRSVCHSLVINFPHNC
jgi:hypothetical protein